MNQQPMPENRSETLARVAANGTFDVIVVGGGINGIGAFRDLSLQGLRVLVVDMNDFCSGCSSAPSRMIHGGLRYLENGEFDLVRESLEERDALLKNAPHMVRPLPTTVPIRSIFSGVLNGLANFIRLPSKPTERGALTIKLGLLLYDWITRRDRLLPTHEFNLKKATELRWPGIRKDVSFSAVYHDAWISHPERLGIELIDDATSSKPHPKPHPNPNAIALNYCSLKKEPSGELVVQDMETGSKISVTARAIVNATGAWVDETIATLPTANAPTSTMVEGTKGSHLVIDHPELHKALDGHMIYYENSDGRVCVLFPYLGNVLVGSTDIRVSKPGRMRCDDNEKTYILQSLKYVFPDVVVSDSQIVFRYSGVRPLPKSDQAFTGRISRSHIVQKIDGDVPQFCMIGGKWTTFRAFSEQATDEVLGELGRPRLLSTRNMAIGGGQDYPVDVQEWLSRTRTKFGISMLRAEHVLDNYGSRAWAILQACQDDAEDSALGSGCSYTAAEIGFLIKNERAVHLSDIVLRRTSLAITGVVTLKIIERIADIAANILGWDTAKKQHEISNLVEELDSYHGVSPQTLTSR